MRAIPTPYLVAGAAVAAVLAYVAMRGARGAGESIGGAAVDLVDSTMGGVVVGIGERVGIPATSMTECERAKAEGRTWDASFACPAKDFLTYLWSK